MPKHVRAKVTISRQSRSRRFISVLAAVGLVAGFAISTVALAGPAAAASGPTLANVAQLSEFPSNGGALVSEKCPAGDVMVGMTGNTQSSNGTFVTKVLTLCQPMAVNGNAVVPSGTVVQVGADDTVGGNPVGASGNRPDFTLQCAANAVVVGFETWSDSSGNSQGVHGYQIFCSALNGIGVPTGAISTQLAGSKTGTDSFPQLCPPVSSPGAPGGVGAGYAGADSTNGKTAGASLWCGQVQTTIAAPVLGSTSPASPANSKTPSVTGTAPAGTTVSIYTNATCQGTAAATGSAAQLAAGIAVTVAADHTTQLSATAAANGLVSDCSNSLSYLEDSTGPTLTGEATTPPGEDGWYSGDVTIHWTCSDPGGSGVATCPNDSKIPSEGANLSATATATDNAGNSTQTTVSGINIDRTAPTSIATIAGDQPSGWYSALPLSVALSGSDNLSQIKKIDYRMDGTAGTISGGGGSVTIATSGRHTLSMSAVDRAGNVETAHSVTIDVDTNAPSISATLDPSPLGSWNNSAVHVSITCADPSLADDLPGSGVDGCSLGEGSTTVTNDDGSKTAAVDVTTEGRYALSGATSDQAGNTSSLPVPVNIDETAPIVTAKPDRTPDHGSWYTAPVTFTFSCTDPPLADGGDGSGVPAGSCPSPITLSNDGSNQAVSGDAHDLAGNKGSGGLTGINVDQTGPTVTVEYNGSTTKQPWYNGPVMVHFICDDATSEVATCPPDQKLSAEGSNQSVSETATDNAGNSTPVDVNGINIDLTAPTIEGHITPNPNPRSWNKTDVTVSWNCVDPTLLDGTRGSGVTDCPQPQTVSSEGEDQLVEQDISDVAGNGAQGKVIVSIDKTSPTLTGAPTTAPDGHDGWYITPVTIHWTAGDGLSGVDVSTQPSDMTLSSDGEGLTATATVYDLAGNSTTENSSPVKIDQTPPSTALKSNPPTWSNSSVTLDLTATDTTSGVAATYYAVDDGDYQPGTAVTITSEGRHHLHFYSVDNAGNVEASNTVAVDIDKTGPTVTASQDPMANAAGWNNTSVTVTFTCADGILPDGTPGSGVATCSSDPAGASDVAQDGSTGTVDVALDQEGADQKVSGSATDQAGNTGSGDTSVSIDMTDPKVTAGNVPAPNANDWYNQPVTVSFTCDDPAGRNGTPGSGISQCDDQLTLDTDGKNQGLTAQATDAAGNPGQAMVTGLNIDQTPPTIAPKATPSTPNGNNGWYTRPVTVHFDVADALSGIDPATVPGDVVLRNDGAGQEASASVNDEAGNTASAATGRIFNIDQTAPMVIPSPSVAAPNANGWYDQPVVVTFTCTDATSGVADGSCPATETLGNGRHAPQTLTVYDKAGNATTVIMPEIDVDTVGPTITFTGNAGTYTVDQTVTIGCTATDDLSGIATSDCPTVNAPAYTLPVGQQTVLHATATDLAGNTTNTSASFVVGVSCASMTNLVKTFAGGDNNAVNGLLAKLSAICSAPNAKAKAGVVGAFDNQVRAQTGKALTAAQADYLTRFAALL